MLTSAARGAGYHVWGVLASTVFFAADEQLADLTLAALPMYPVCAPTRSNLPDGGRRRA